MKQAIIAVGIIMFLLAWAAFILYSAFGGAIG